MVSDELYIYPCEWNYRPDHCMYTSVCEGANRDGAHVLHGNRRAMQNQKQPAFKAVYSAFKEVSLFSNSQPISSFVTPQLEILISKSWKEFWKIEILSTNLVVNYKFSFLKKNLPSVEQT